jgi:hypothetical protein
MTNDCRAAIGDYGAAIGDYRVSIDDYRVAINDYRAVIDDYSDVQICRRAVMADYSYVWMLNTSSKSGHIRTRF